MSAAKYTANTANTAAAAAATVPTVNLTIDGQSVQVPAGTKVIEAARQAGINIPALCYDPGLSAVGACRMCVVEVEKARSLMAACATPVTEGMVVRTKTPRVVKARETILHLLLANHPQDCLTCEKNGECLLQDYAYEYNVREPKYHGERKDFAIDDVNPFFVRDHNKCILCGRCVRTCSEVMDIGAVDYSFRGFKSKVTTAFDVPLEESPCVFCGNCVAVCPTGALTPKFRAGQGRSWEIERTLTTCPYCGVGCQMYLLTKNGKVIGAEPADGEANHGKLCVKGRFGSYEFVNSPDRLTKPLIRVAPKSDAVALSEAEGRLDQAKARAQFREATWDEALNLVAARLSNIKEEHGSEALAGLSSARCTNEENYVMQKLVRAVFGNNNIDHCARLCHASTVAGLAMSFGSGAMTNSIDEIGGADAILIIGSNTTEAHPVIGIQVKKAVRQGAKLIVIDPRRIELAEKADIHLQQAPGSDVAVLNGLMNVILAEGLQDEAFISERTENFDAFKAVVAKYTPEKVEEISGVPTDALRAAARLYAGAARASIIYSMGITQHTTGTDNVQTVANLAMVTGNLGRESTGVNPLRGQNNVQGACDVGALVNVYPGYQSVTDPAAKAKFEAAWKPLGPLSTKVGLTVTEVTAAAHEGHLHGLYVMGENPMVSDPDINHVREALAKLDFLVVQDIFLTETASFADVILPAASFAEKDGTFTNTERRVQMIRPAVKSPGQARTDWEIIADVATRMGYPMKYSSTAEIAREIASVTPIYGGITHDRLGDARGLQWPCPSADHPGTVYLHKGKFSRGKGAFAPIEYIAPAEGVSEEYPLVLSTGRILYHYHTGTMSRRARGLDWARPEGYVEINPQTAKSLGIKHGDKVRVTSKRGTVVTNAKVTSVTGPRVVFMPFHFAEAAANLLTNPAVDPKAKIPEFKVAAVRVEKV